MAKVAKQTLAVLILTTSFIALTQGCSSSQVKGRVIASQIGAGRKPASMNLSYDLTYQDIMACGRLYSFPVVKSPDPELRVIFEDQMLPQSVLRINLPGKLASFRSTEARVYHQGNPSAVPPHDLLLMLPVTSDDPQIQKRYCDNLSAIKKYFIEASLRGKAPVIKTKLIELNITSVRGKGRRSRTQVTLELKNQFEMAARADSSVANDATPAESFFSRWLSGTQFPSSNVDHIVISTKNYLPEAQALSQSRIQAGLGSIAVSLEQIPGMKPGDAVPAQCQGVYFDECYLSASNPLSGVSFQASSALAGMGGWNDMDSPGQRKIADAAGLVRAYLRSVKIAHPELKYIVLMGDLFQLPPRFTTQNSYSSGPAPVENFVSTDYYYSDLFSVWLFSDRISFSSINTTGWPCGDECAQPNTNWDTTAFRWPISYPFARTMVDPVYYNFNNPTQGAQGLAKMVSVGRVVAKPLPGQAKDPAVAKYVEKLTRWDAWPGERSKFTVVSGDGVYVRKNFQDFEDQLGPFRYFGEGFGASFVTPANRPADYSTTECSHQPPSNDWHSYPLTSDYNTDDLYFYQSEPKRCKPVDPQANWTRLPDPAEVTREISRTGFTFMFHSAHAGYSGIGYQSDGNGYGEGRSFRNFNVRYNEGGRYSFASRPGFEDFANYQEVNGHANGFVISSGCSPSSYFGGLPAVPLFPNSGRSAGEYLVMLENAGAVGTYMNTDVGYFYSDPMFEMDLIRSMKKIGDTLQTPRFGDVLIDLFKTVVPAQDHSYQVLNRVFLGDPSAKLFNKNSVLIDLHPENADQESP
ncbi:MAG: hypothetical protein H7333_12600 [Bdellovibrionales bacterium]|nr:hypothetical protein [Oligoflexia bacterium]